MKVKFSRKVDSKLKLLSRKNPHLTKQVRKQIKIFKIDPSYKSLRLHKLEGSLGKFWSISINRSIRMVYEQRDGDVAYFVDIGTHDEVYERN